MRSQTFSVGLVVLLALSNHSYGQLSSQEYIKTISDLVNQKANGDATAISPLQTLYYTQLLQPGFLWRDLTTMILLSTSTEYENASLFMDHFSKNFAEKLRLPYASPAKTPADEIIAAPKKESVLKEPNTDLPTAVKMESVSEVKVIEKKVLAPANAANKSAPVVAAPETYVMDMPSDFESIKNADYVEYGSIGFFHNAAIIHPSYQTEMESLAVHMKADLNIKLRIYGHCSGTENRTIIAAGIMTKFFEISNQDQKRTVTAKELTELRASYAKRYLISQGIRPERIHVIGEGSEKMIYPPASEHAHYNDRIELKLIRSTEL